MQAREIICEQGSPEWHQARAGVITASMTHELVKRVGGLTDQQTQYVEAIRAGKSKDEAKVIAGYKTAPRWTDKHQAVLDGESIGDYTEAAKDYAFRLAVERISGLSLDEGIETYAMRRGHELEPAARAAHAMEIGRAVRQVGFVVSDCGRFGASADGAIDGDGGAEYKCFIDPCKLRAIIISRDVSDHLWQCQHGMWVTGRQWWDFCLYCPALESAGRDLERFRIERCEETIKRIEAECLAFDGLVEEYRNALIQAPKKQPATRAS